MTRREATWLLLVLVVPGLFVVYEAAALSGVAPWHTVSYYAQRDGRVDVGVIALACGTLVGFVAWWVRHMRTRIDK